MLKENLEKIKRIWEAEGVDLAEPLLISEVIAVFDNLKITISQEIIDVYSSIGGMIDDWMNEELFSFWTIDKIIEENKPNSDITFFADFLIESHRYYFRSENEKVSSIHIYYDENSTEKIAGSFNEFFEHYLIKPANILFGRENTDKNLL